METQFGRAPDSGNFYILSNLFLILGNVKTHVILKLDNRRIMITEPSFKLVFQLKCFKLGLSNLSILEVIFLKKNYQMVKIEPSILKIQIVQSTLLNTKAHQILQEFKINVAYVIKKL